MNLTALRGCFFMQQNNYILHNQGDAHDQQL